MIQINSIPSKPKSLVTLFELNHLPTRNSHNYEKICQLFRSTFRTINEIYSWGDMCVELEHAKELIVWPIPATLINI